LVNNLFKSSHFPWYTTLRSVRVRKSVQNQDQTREVRAFIGEGVPQSGSTAKRLAIIFSQSPFQTYLRERERENSSPTTKHQKASESGKGKEGAGSGRELEGGGRDGDIKRSKKGCYFVEAWSRTRTLSIVTWAETDHIKKGGPGGKKRDKNLKSAKNKTVQKVAAFQEISESNRSERGARLGV